MLIFEIKFASDNESLIGGFFKLDNEKRSLDRISMYFYSKEAFFHFGDEVELKRENAICLDIITNPPKIGLWCCVDKQH